jgi:hypothetical protein
MSGDEVKNHEPLKAENGFDMLFVTEDRLSFFIEVLIYIVRLFKLGACARMVE